MTQAGIFDLASPEFHKTINNRDGNARITTFAQDQQGLIWVGTETGLYYYDGYNYQAADFINSEHTALPKAWVTDIAIDRAGTIWVSSYQEGLLKLDPLLKRYKQYKNDPASSQSISANRVAKILPDDNRGLWLATDNGLNYLDIENEVFSQHQHPTQQAQSKLANRTREILINKKGELLIGSWDGIHQYDPSENSYRRVSGSDSNLLANKIVRKIVEDSQGRLWIGTYDDGLYTLSSRGELQRLESDQRINDILQVNGQHIWTTSLEQGISVYDIDSLKRIQIYRHDPYNPASPSANYSRGLLLDQAGQIWIAITDFGANRVDPNNQFSRTLFPSSQDASKLSFKDVYSIAQLQDGSIWFGSSGNGIDVFDPDTGRSHSYRANSDVKGALQSNFITRIMEHSNGDIWIGSAGNGLFRFDKSSEVFEQFSLGESSAVDTISHIIEDGNGDLILGTGSSYIKLDVNNQKFIDIEFPENQSSKVGNVMTSGPDGSVWVASFNEIAVLRKGRTQLEQVPLSIPKGVDNNFRIQGLNIYPDGELVLVSSNAILKAESVQTNQDGALELDLLARHQSPIETLFRMNNGDYWGATAFYDASQKKVIALSQADGVYNRSQFLSSAIQSSDGTLLFGGGFGVTVVRPDYYRPWNFKPSIITTEVKLDGNILHGDARNLTIPAGYSSFSIGYAALDYTSPAELKYMQKLEGYDDDWVEVSSKDRKATYTNLAAGDYSLQLRASNRSGAWSDKQLTINISILPAWYETLVFKLLASLSLIALIWLAFQLRLKQINAKRQQLSLLVKQRTQELETSLQELRETQDQLVASQKNAALGRLVSGMAHELNTPMGVVKTGFSLVKEQAKFAIEERASMPISHDVISRKLKHLEKSCELVESNVEKMINLISNFKLVNADQDNPRPQRFMVMPMLEELLIPLKDKLKQAKVEAFITGEQHVFLNSLQGSLRHCLNELIENALRHGFEKTPSISGPRFIEIRVSQLPCAHENSRISHWVKLRIRDNGKGIDDQLIGNIFDPFVAKQAQDTGLGLHIVYNTITLQMRGEISIANEDGACIEIKLPSYHFNTESLPELDSYEPSND